MRIRIRILLLIKLIVIGICDHRSIDPPELNCQLPRLYFEPLKLLNFYFNADPDPIFPAFHSNADPDPASNNNADS
jgi:hypothetical protein